MFSLLRPLFLCLSVLIGTGMFTSNAHASYYMYIINPDKTVYNIQWNGPGPNHIVDHPEFGPNVQIACWYIHAPDSHVPNAGLKFNTGGDKLWVEPYFTGSGFNLPMNIQVDAGKPYINQHYSNRTPGNTAWIGIDADHAFEVWDCG